MKKVSIYLISILLLFLVTGCASEKAPTGPATIPNEEKTPSDTEDDVAQEEEQDNTVQQYISLNTTLPDAFPPGVELVVIENETDDGTMYIVNYGIEGKVIDYYNLYREYIDQAGYTDIIDASNGNADPETSLENFMAKLDGN